MYLAAVLIGGITLMIAVIVKRKDNA